MSGPRIDHAEILRLHHRGLTARQIAERVGCTTKTVQRVRKANGLSRVVPATVGVPVSTERLEFAARLFDDGASRAEVRRSVGMGWGTLAKFFPGRAWTKAEASAFANVVRRSRQLGVR